jgi:EmrB/QacA subfamily drug resistance transporter
MSTGSHPRRWTILALILAAEAMDMLDGTIVNVAAPTIHVELYASASALQWIIGGYSLAFAVGLIGGGRLGDVYGRKRMFMIGSAGFVVFSIACSCAVSPTMLIVCRLLQGVAAAALIPQGFGIMHDVFAEEELGKAFTVFGPVIGLSAVLGPILGGALIAANTFGAGWRLIFLVNLPLGLVAAIGAARLMGESRSARRPDLDLIGTAIAALAMGLLIYPLIQGRDAGWPAWTYLMIAGSAAAFAVLVLWSRRERSHGRDAIVEPSIFGHRAYSAGIASVLVVFAGMIGTLLSITLFLQLGEHFSAIHAGVSVAPFALGSAIGATVAGALLAPRFGRLALQLASVVLAGGVWWMHAVLVSHALTTSSWDLAPPMLVAGIGIGAIVAPLFGFILVSVSGEEVGSASGVMNAIQQLGGALGVAAIGTLFFSTLARHGYVAALEHALVAELLSTPILLALLSLLPPREEQAAGLPDRPEARERLGSPAVDAPGAERSLTPGPR